MNRESDDLPNLVDKTLSTTRRFDALKVYMMLRALGCEAMGAMVDHLLAQTRAIAEKIRNSTQYELLAPPRLSTILFRYVVGDSRVSIDEFNRGLRSALLQKGVAVLGETVVNEQVALKLTILNPCLREAEFDELLQLISHFAESRRDEIIRTGTSRTKMASADCLAGGVLA
ncbi:pyridoxal-dependent decarboxylase [Trinickia soli]|uniref:pyridoxal-dependent decarboxylase n=1 Tax=Trinickia soli TaxID=380675 RepID=UPI0022B8593C|nr:pyridoxal-dependent decarboxylase [Trinickia soli]